MTPGSTFTNMRYVLMNMTTPKARKDHRRAWCGQTIPKGEVYKREQSIYDNHWQNHKWHTECLAACHEEHKTSRECEFNPGENERPKKPQSATSNEQP